MRKRGKVAVGHRICCGWMKYKALQRIYEDKHIPVKFRLKLFDATISSTMLYSLQTCPFTQELENRLDVVQTKMLRRLVGWVCTSDET